MRKVVVGCWLGLWAVVRAELTDRVAILTTERSQAEPWCMGLLIASDVLVAYAHCVQPWQSNLTWAFFGNATEGVHGFNTTQGNGTSSSQVHDIEVGDMDAWVRITDVKLHPDYVNEGKSGAVDLAVLKLEYPRLGIPFGLASTLLSESSLGVDSYHALQLSNEFATSLHGEKVRSVDDVVTINCGPDLCDLANPVIVSDWTMENAFLVRDEVLIGLFVHNSVVVLSDHASFLNPTGVNERKWRPATMVVGGRETAIQGYLVGLRLTKASENFCLGSLIAPKVVLTAAHCIHDVQVGWVSVGSSDVSGEADGEQIKVKSTTIHPDFNLKTFRNDYAIIELEYMSIQKPITLYRSVNEEKVPSKRLTLYGYTSSADSKEPETLNAVDLPIMSDDKCKNALQLSQFDANMLCAGGEEGKDGCFGDSGGPLVQQSSENTTLVALSSFGRGCGLRGIPAVYSMVQHAASFIDKHARGHKWNAPDPLGPEASRSLPPSTNSTGTQTPSRTPSPESLDIVKRIAKKEAMTFVPYISVNRTNSFTVSASSSSSFTRTVLTNLLLQTRNDSSHLDDARLVHPYSCKDKLTFYSSADLQRLHNVINAFESRPIRRRRARFHPPRQ
ncbi:hypothetical protein Poli38472_011659 [Pythium oligandrum]|uniref:Peptidase S1 domain-containing protein n=1 Tax=Pythium oligandrum TaxID=41045 RepID=A0A8K1CJL4_PYTOL|nr:hypothetical protein Poli38472_011659 [Pythium oligandrum]|eukprot:TMW64779.1 hypothetical protein Poli38472_011659 [Pythium oligandrum]